MWNFLSLVQEFLKCETASLPLRSSQPTNQQKAVEPAHTRFFLTLCTPGITVVIVTFDNMKHCFVLALIWAARQVALGCWGVWWSRVVVFLPVTESAIKVTSLGTYRCRPFCTVYDGNHWAVSTMRKLRVFFGKFLVVSSFFHVYLVSAPPRWVPAWCAQSKRTSNACWLAPPLLSNCWLFVWLDRSSLGAP